MFGIYMILYQMAFFPDSVSHNLGPGTRIESDNVVPDSL